MTSSVACATAILPGKPAPAVALSRVVPTAKTTRSAAKPKAAATPAPAGSYRRIYAVVARIPRGKVATYGQIAALADLPRQARLVGYALNVLPPDTRLPWHRVVNAQGQISLRSNGLGHDQIQAQLLGREGVRLVAGRIALDQHRWQPALRLKR